MTGFGGVILGFFLKALADWYTERRQEDRQFHAAALLVSDELQANIVKLNIARKINECPEPLESDAYHRYELILARRLPPGRAHCPKVSGVMGSGVRFSEGWSRSGCMLIPAA